MSSRKIQNRVCINNMTFKMFVSFLFFFMVRLPMGASVCLEYPVIGTLDCSKENLNSIPYSKVMSWVKNANFAHNNLTARNVTRLLALFPNVMQIDLRYNPVKCLTTAQVVILSDCQSTISPATTRLNVTKYSHIITTLSANVSITITADNGKSPLLLIIVLLVCIVVCIVFVCSLVVWLMRRRLRPSNSVSTENLSLNASFDSDKEVSLYVNETSL